MIDKWADRVKKIPLILFVIFFFLIAIANLVIIESTIINFGEICVLFLMILLSSFFVLLFKLQKTKLFSTLGINEVLLFLWTPTVLFLFFVLNYTISTTEYEGTLKLSEHELYEIEEGRYMAYKIELSIEYNLELSFHYAEVNVKTDEINYCFKRGIFGYTVFQKEIIRH